MGPPDTWARWFDSLAPSNVDWCEANYAISPYVAEFWNAMSSVPMTGVAFYGLYNLYVWALALAYAPLSTARSYQQTGRHASRFDDGL